MDTAADEISSQLAEVESRELVRIEEALEKIREGNYGDCEGCDKPIPLARLQAVPYATMCIECQRKTEKRTSNSNSRYGQGTSTHCRAVLSLFHAEARSFQRSVTATHFLLCAFA